MSLILTLLQFLLFLPFPLITLFYVCFYYYFNSHVRGEKERLIKIKGFLFVVVEAISQKYSWQHDDFA